jgi:DNA-binding CsgD family transcriptional regulator
MIKDSARLEAQRLLSIGHTRKEIAKRLSISPSLAQIILSKDERGRREKANIKSKECNKISREKKHRHLKIIKMKMGGKCYKCGYEKSLLALDFHHIDPKSKDGNVSKFYDPTLREEEAKKCVLLCANCHREFHGGLITLDQKRQNFGEI